MAPADVQASAAAGCDRRVESITKCPGAALVHTPEPMQRPQSTSSLQSLAMRFPPFGRIRVVDRPDLVRRPNINS